MSRTHFSVALTALLLTIGLVLAVANRGTPKVLHTNLEHLPTEIAGYQGQEDRFPQEVYNVLQADFNLYRHYRSPEGKELNLYIGYYGTAKGGRTGHNPYGCLPGAGWAIVDTGTVVIRPSYSPQGVKVNYVLARKGGVDNLLLHWYQTAGNRVMATGLQQNLERFKDRVLYNRNDGAYVQVSSLIIEGDIPVVRSRLARFARKLMELLPEYWPQEG